MQALVLADDRFYGFKKTNKHEYLTKQSERDVEIYNTPQSPVSEFCPRGRGRVHDWSSAYSVLAIGVVAGAPAAGIGVGQGLATSGALGYEYVVRVAYDCTVLLSYHEQ